MMRYQRYITLENPDRKDRWKTLTSLGPDQSFTVSKNGLIFHLDQGRNHKIASSVFFARNIKRRQSWSLSRAHLEASTLEDNFYHHTKEDHRYTRCWTISRNPSKNAIFGNPKNHNHGFVGWSIANPVPYLPTRLMGIPSWFFQEIKEPSQILIHNPS